MSAAQTWSFQRLDQRALIEQIKAWGWTVYELRKEGAKIEPAAGTTIAVDANVSVEVVYVPPVDEQETVLAEAEIIFNALDVGRRPLAQADEVGRRARELLTEAGVEAQMRLPGPERG